MKTGKANPKDWTPPADAVVEETTTLDWTPPQDAVELKKKGHTVSDQSSEEGGKQQQSSASGKPLRKDTMPSEKPINELDQQLEQARQNNAEQVQNSKQDFSSLGKLKTEPSVNPFGKGTGLTGDISNNIASLTKGTKANLDEIGKTASLDFFKEQNNKLNASLKAPESVKTEQTTTLPKEKTSDLTANRLQSEDKATLEQMKKDEADNGISRFGSAAGTFDQSVVKLATGIALKFPSIAVAYALPGDNDPQKNLFYKLADFIDKKAEEAFPNNPKFRGEMSETMAETGATLMSFMVGGAMGKTTTLAELTVPATKAVLQQTAEHVPGAFMASASTASSEYENALKSGASQETALNTWRNNLFSGVPFLISPTFKVFEQLAGEGAIKVAAKQGTQGGIAGMFQMGSSHALENLSAQATYDKAREITDGVLETGGSGFAINGLITGLISAVTHKAVGASPADKAKYDQTVKYLMDQKKKVENLGNTDYFIKKSEVSEEELNHPYVQHIINENERHKDALVADQKEEESSFLGKISSRAGNIIFGDEVKNQQRIIDDYKKNPLKELKKDLDQFERWKKAEGDKYEGDWDGNIENTKKAIEDITAIREKANVSPKLPDVVTDHTAKVVDSSDKTNIETAAENIAKKVDGMSVDEIVETVKGNKTPEEGVQNDSGNEQGLPGEKREGQEPIKAEPEQSSSTQETGDSGVVQKSPEEEVSQQRGKGEFEEVDREEVERQIAPFADRLVQIEHEFKNKGYEISDEHDGETVVTKDGEIVDPQDVPDSLKKLAGDYEAMVMKIGKVADPMRALSQARERAKPTDTTYEEVKDEAPESKQIGGTGEPAAAAEAPKEEALPLQGDQKGKEQKDKLVDAINKTKSGGISNSEFEKEIQKANGLREKAKALENKSDLDSQSKRYDLIDQAKEIEKQATDKVTPFEKIVDNTDEIPKSKGYNEGKCRALSKEHQKKYGGEYKEVKVNNSDGTTVVHAIVDHGDYVYEPQTDSLFKKEVFDDYFGQKETSKPTNKVKIQEQIQSRIAIARESVKKAKEELSTKKNQKASEEEINKAKKRVSTAKTEQSRAEKEMAKFMEGERQKLGEVDEDRVPIHNITDPEVISQMYDEEVKSSGMTHNEETIADVIATAKGINPKSVARHGDMNSVSDEMRDTYFHDEGTNMDQIAQDASEIMGKDESVTPDDVWDYMEKFPGGVKEQTPKNNPRLLALNNRHIELTGKSINRGGMEGRAKKRMEQIEAASEDRSNEVKEVVSSFTKDGEIDYKAMSDKMANEESWFTGFPFNLSKEQFKNLKKEVDAKSRRQEKLASRMQADRESGQQAETTKEAPGEKSKVAEAKAKFEARLQSLKGKWDALGEVGAIEDQKERARKHYELHREMVGAAKDLIDYGIESVKQFAEVLGRSIDEAVKRAWDDAKAELDGGVPEITGPEYYEVKGDNERVSGIKKALVPEESVLEMQDDLEKKTNQEFLDQAKKDVDSGEINPQAIVADVVDRHRALQTHEVAALVYYKTQLDNRFDAVNQVIAMNKAEGGDPVQLSIDQKEAKILSAQIDDFHEMQLITAREQSRAFGLRKMLLDNQYNLQKQVNQYKANSADGEVPPEVMEHFKQIDDKLKKANQKIAELEKTSKERAESGAMDAIKDEVKKESTKPRERRGRERMSSAIDNIKKILSEQKSGFAFDPKKEAERRLNQDKRLMRELVELGKGMIEETLATTKNVGEKIKKFVEDNFGDSVKWSDYEKDVTDSIIESLPKPSVVEGKLKIPKSVIHDLVESGIDNIDDLTDAIHEKVKIDNPEITKRQVRDAITEYGKTSSLNKEEIATKVREIKRVGRLVSQLEDVQAKIRPLRSGLQRDKLTQKERDLQRDLKEAMKDLPDDPAHNEAVWKTAIEGVKTRLKNQIEDLEQQLNTGKKTTPKKGIKYDEEALALQAKRDELRERLQEIEGKQGISDEQKLRQAVAGAEKSLKEYERRIKEGDFEAKKQGNKVSSPELEALRAKRDAAKEQLDKIKNELGIADKEKLNKAKENAKKAIVEYERRIKEGDFSKRTKGESVIADRELEKALIEKERAKFEYDVAQEKNRLANRPMTEKAKDLIIDAFSIPKSLISSVDLSAPLRQGFLLSVGHPGSARKAFVKMFRSMASKQYHEDWLHKLHQSDIFPTIRGSKLYIAEEHAKLSAREENFVSHIINKVPGIGRIVSGSERAYSGYLNALRVDVFSKGVDQLKDAGYSMQNNKKAFQDWASFINNASGRGNLGGFERSAPALNALFFSPRFLASRLNVMNPVTYVKMDPKVRMMAMKDTMAYIGFGISVLGMAAAAGAEVEKDPRSTDFGKIKVGNTRYDIWAGFQPIVRVLCQIGPKILGGGRVKNKDGTITELNTGLWGKDTRMDVVGKFFRTKEAPTVSSLHNLFVGSDLMGKDVSPQGELLKNMIPLYVQDMYNIYQQEGLKEAATIAIPAVFGIGVQNQQPKHKTYKQILQDISKSSKSGVPTERDYKKMINAENP